MEEQTFEVDDGHKEVHRFLAKILNSRNSPAFKGSVALATAYTATDATTGGVMRQLAISELENTGKTVCYDPIFEDSRDKIFARAIIEIVEMVLSGVGLATYFDTESVGLEMDHDEAGYEAEDDGEALGGS